MDVSAWTNGSEKYGIRISKNDRRDFFNPSWEWIDVEIDGNMHRFPLTPSFWNKCVEFRDSDEPVLRDWFQQQGVLSWPDRHPPHFRLEVIDEVIDNQRFRLERQQH